MSGGFTVQQTNNFFEKIFYSFFPGVVTHFCGKQQDKSLRGKKQKQKKYGGKFEQTMPFSASFFFLFPPPLHITQNNKHIKDHNNFWPSSGLGRNGLFITPKTERGEEETGSKELHPTTRA